MGFSTTLTKAAVSIAEKLSSAKAILIIAKDKPEQIPVQFNPSEYKITEGSQYSEKTRRNKDEPVVNFNGTPMSTLSVKLYFDCDDLGSLSSAAGAVVGALTGSESKTNELSKTIDKITALTYIDGDNHQPPGCVFVWGSLQFVGFAQSVSTTYTMFDNMGKPLRAIVDLTIKGFNGASTERKSPLMSPDRTKARTMTEDTNIWAMAEKEYGDVREWRRIADANDIMNPLDIPIGRMLRVPSIND